MLGELLVDAFRTASLTADADGVCGRAIDAFHLAPPALPAAPRPFANFSSLGLRTAIDFVLVARWCVRWLIALG